MNRTTLNVLLVVLVLIVFGTATDSELTPEPGPDVVAPSELRRSVAAALSGRHESAREYAKLYQAAAELHDVAHPVEIRDWLARYVAMDPFPRVAAMQDVVRKHMEPFSELVSESQWTDELKEQHRRALMALSDACWRASR